MIEATFRIQGMKCDGCVHSVSTVLNALPGVEVESVAIGRARVRLAPGELAEMSLLEALQKAGFAAARE